MKKIKFLSAVALCAVMCLFNSCTKEASFDEALLVGKWQSGTEFEVYEANHEGYLWDSADEISETDTKQKFTWSLESATLTQIHIMEMGAKIPKTYTVTYLSDTRLSYEDDFGKSKTYTKVVE